MEAAPVVTLIAVFAAIAVIAAFLITVIYQLSMVWQRLNTILGAVGQVIEKTEVLDPIISDIAANVEAGNQALTGAVDRLKARKGYVSDGHGYGDREPAGLGTSAAVDPPPNVYTNY